MKERPRFAKASEQMKEWAGALGAEMLTWPQVTARVMFGMTAYYRKGAVFAALPRTRAFETPNSIAFKLYRKTPQIRKALAADPRINPAWQEARWIALELHDEKDLGGALKWFELAYRACLSRTNSRR